ncbi:MAG TPA: DNA polymerase [Pirellulaceae bacterium]|nr:DNA polymerase [Pirellulaceae bacterium]
MFARGCPIRLHYEGDPHQREVYDTQLLQRLYLLATDGSDGHDRSSLNDCIEQHLNAQKAKELRTAAGGPNPLALDSYVHRPLEDIPGFLLQRLVRQVQATYLIYRQLRRSTRKVLDSNPDAEGYISPAWLKKSQRKWGPLTHHIQLKAAIVLRSVERAGLPIDTERSADLRQQLEEAAAAYRVRLRKYGYQPRQRGSAKALQEILRREVAPQVDIPLPRVANLDAYATSTEALGPVAEQHEFVSDFLAYQEVDKLLGTFVSRLGKGVLHPSFNVLVRSGRTSSFGEINAQNLPRDERVRSCFVAPPGRVFVCADYHAIEMATLAQCILSQTQIPSRLAEILNDGQDPHRLVAAKVTGKSPEQVTEEERQRAKAINFGKPAGMGDRALQSYAKANYGVVLSDDEVRRFSRSWFKLFPEMREFLRAESDLVELVAQFFQLTPEAHYRATGDRWLLEDQEHCHDCEEPSGSLGGMLLKVLASSRPAGKRGRPYYPRNVDFLWRMAKRRANALPEFIRQPIRSRKPSPRLRRETVDFLDRLQVFTLTGRLRAAASFCARRNTLFQGLAADGAKLALWRLWRAGYLIHNFIHDEILVSVPDDAHVEEHRERIRRLMIDAMREVVPHVAIDVSAYVSQQWSRPTCGDK